MTASHRKTTFGELVVLDPPCTWKQLAQAAPSSWKCYTDARMLYDAKVQAEDPAIYSWLLDLVQQGIRIQHDAHNVFVGRATRRLRLYHQRSLQGPMQNADQQSKPTKGAGAQARKRAANVSDEDGSEDEMADAWARGADEAGPSRGPSSRVPRNDHRARAARNAASASHHAPLVDDIAASALLHLQTRSREIDVERQALLMRLGSSLGDDFILSLLTEVEARVSALADQRSANIQSAMQQQLAERDQLIAHLQAQAVESATQVARLQHAAGLMDSGGNGLSPAAAAAQYGFNGQSSAHVSVRACPVSSGGGGQQGYSRGGNGGNSLQEQLGVKSEKCSAGGTLSSAQLSLQTQDACMTADCKGAGPSMIRGSGPLSGSSAFAVQSQGGSGCYVSGHGGYGSSNGLSFAGNVHSHNLISFLEASAIKYQEAAAAAAAMAAGGRNSAMPNGVGNLGVERGQSTSGIGGAGTSQPVVVHPHIATPGEAFWGSAAAVVGRGGNANQKDPRLTLLGVDHLRNSQHSGNRMSGGYREFVAEDDDGAAEEEDGEAEERSSQKDTDSAVAGSDGRDSADSVPARRLQQQQKKQQQATAVGGTGSPAIGNLAAAPAAIAAQ